MPFRLWLVLACALAAAAPVPSAHAARPNLVVILADDLGWGDLRSYNPESRIPTPHLDRLAAEGMRFTDAHSPSAVCTPTRYGLLTGRYAWRSRLKNGVLYGYSPPLIEPGRATLASYLRDAGYATGMVGKWHLGLGYALRQQARGSAATAAGASPGPAAAPDPDPSDIDWSQPLSAGPHTAGFDYVFAIPASLDMAPYLYVENDRILVPPTGRTEGSRSQRQGGGGFWREGPIAPGFTIEGCHPELAAKAVEFLAQRHRKQPFFLYLALTGPHDPWVPTPEFRGRSGAGARGDAVAQLDDAVGRILRALDVGGLARETVIVFTSDNGAHWLPPEVASTGHAANGPWRGMKSDAWEGGHRVPFIVRWPGRTPPGAVSGALVGLNDLFATMADIVGRPAPPGAAEDSISFLAALRGRRVRERPPLVLHSIRGTFAVRQGSWKWIAGPDGGGWTPGRVSTPGQLYDLASDPGELSNRGSEDPARVAAFESALRRIQSGDPRPARPWWRRAAP